MEIDAWEYHVWQEWNKKIWGNTLSLDNSYDDGKIHHQESFFEIDEDGTICQRAPEFYVDTHYMKLVKGNDYYLLPKRFIKEFPLIPDKCQKLHLKKSDTQVWNFIKDISSLAIPEKLTLDLNDLVDIFNPIVHSNPIDWKFLKMVSFASGVKLGVCGKCGLGKNANSTIMRQIFNNVAPKVKTPTAAKFYRILYYNMKINVDEITSWKKPQIQIIEDMMSELGDGAPNMDKFSLDANRLLEKMDDIGSKSFTFTFNPPTKKNPRLIQDQFINYDKIEDRYPIFYVDGIVQQAMVKQSEYVSKQIMEKNFDSMCAITSNIYYYQNNLYKHLHNWDRNGLKLKRNPRFLNNLNGLLDVIDACSKTQIEFDGWIKYMDDSFNMFLYRNKPIECSKEEAVQVVL